MGCAGAQEGFRRTTRRLVPGSRLRPFHRHPDQSGGLDIAPGPLQEVVRRNRHGEEDLGNLLWSLLLLDRFYRDDRPSSGLTA